MDNKVMFIPADPKNVFYMLVRAEYTLERGTNGPGLNKAQMVIDDDERKGRQSVAVWYDGGTDAFLSSLNNGQIYIRGHGNPGSDELELARNGERVNYTEVVQRLITSGLKREFSGKIKCFNCHSAESANGRDAFAQLLADEMWSRGYKYCTYHGYTDAIDSYPMAKAKGAPVANEVLHKYRRESDGRTSRGRASTGRVQITPRVKPPSFAQKFAKKFF